MGFSSACGARAVTRVALLDDFRAFSLAVAVLAKTENGQDAVDASTETAAETDRDEENDAC